MNIEKITVEEAKDLLDQDRGVNFIDVRNPEAWQDADKKLPGAMRVPTKKVKEHLDELSKDQIYIPY